MAHLGSAERARPGQSIAAAAFISGNNLMLAERDADRRRRSRSALASEQEIRLAEVGHARMEGVAAIPRALINLAALAPRRSR